MDVVRDTGGSNIGNVIVQTNINFKPRPVSNNEPSKMQRHGSTDVRVEPEGGKNK